MSHSNAGFSNSRQIDQLMRQQNLQLRDFVTAIPQELRQPIEWKSWLGLSRVLISIGCCQYLLFSLEITLDSSLWWTLPILSVLWCLYGAILLGFFLIGHDCGHGSFSKHRSVNSIVGTLCTSPIFNGYRTWILTHNHHHQFTQIRGEDVDWSSHLVTKEQYESLCWRTDFAIKLGYTIPFGIFFWIMWNALQRASRVQPMLTPTIYQRNKKTLLYSNLFMLLMTTGIYASFWYFTGFWGLLKYHGIPVLIASLLAGVMVSVGHANINTIWYEREDWSPVRGQLVSTYDYRFPSWLEWFVLNINVHIPHHISVRIPWYNLNKAATKLQESYPDFYQELPFRFTDMKWIIWAPFLERDSETGYYQMSLSSIAGK